MMDFTNVKAITIPEGNVVSIAHGNDILWQKKYKKELSYLESTGTQYIDTGVYPDSTYTFDSSVAVLKDNYNCVYWGTRNNGASDTENSQCYLNSNTTSGTFPTISLFSTSVLVEGNWNSNIIPVVGELYELSNITVVPTMKKMTFPIILFGFNIIGNINTALGICRIGKWVAYSNGKVVRDFIPVLDWNDKPCMYDKVTDTLFYNKGTGDFIGGE